MEQMEVQVLIGFKHQMVQLPVQAVVEVAAHPMLTLHLETAVYMEAGQVMEDQLVELEPQEL
jgi:hypothetical protein